MTDHDKATFLRNNGWSLWYNENYWVHPKTVEDPSRQDYTNYGMDIDSAVEFETKNMPPFKCYGLPALSKYLYRG